MHCSRKGTCARMIRTTRRSLLRTAAAGMALPAVARAAEAATEITFYFPVAVGGPITRIIDGYAADFQRESPAIKVTPIYAGTYQDTLTKTQTALKANAGPQMAVLLSTDVFSLIDDDLIVPFDALAQRWLGQCLAAQLLSCVPEEWRDRRPNLGRAVPAIDDRAVLEQGGISGRRGGSGTAASELGRARRVRAKADAAERRQRGSLGCADPRQRLCLLAVSGTRHRGRRHVGQSRRHRDGLCRARLRRGSALLDRPCGEVPGASARHRRLGRHAARFSRTESRDDLDHDRQPVEHSHQCEISLWGRDAAGGQTARHTHGRGNFYLFKTASPPQRDAALQFLRWITSPERAAQWGIDTGYVATRPDAWETSRMRSYVADFPAAAVARDQLQYAVAELSTHDNQRVTQALNDGLQAALLGRKAPDAALAEAQATAARLLRPFHR